jgi:2-polyprenyl-6-methoxyphenol hydroxylase-like FAD-dependent oxidoreductase
LAQLLRVNARGPPARFHRGRLETLLAEDLGVRWGHDLSGVVSAGRDNYDKHTPADKKGRGFTTLRFGNGTEVSAFLVIGADGVHSSLRAQVTAGQRPRVLPYVVFRSKRRIPIEVFKDVFEAFLEEDAAELRRDGYILRILVDDILASEVSVSWTYSRRAKAAGVVLYKPARSLDEERSIPAEFYEEIAEVRGLEGGFITYIPRGTA